MPLEPAAQILVARFETQKFLYSLAFVSLWIVVIEHRASMAAMDVLAEATSSAGVYFVPSQPQNRTTYPEITISEKEHSPTAMKTTTTSWSHGSGYDWQLSTEENYRLDPRSGDEFVGDFKEFRNRLDPTYHSSYAAERQILQDTIIRSLLNPGEETAGFPVPAGFDTNCKENSRPFDKNCDKEQGVSLQGEAKEQEDQHQGPISINDQNKTIPTPWIIFTAGVYGAGKSHTIQKLQKLGCFPPRSSFLGVDPDEIRRKLPEFSLYRADEAGALTQKESGMMAEILTDIALSSGKNVVVDGSLRDAAWHEGYFHSLRSRFRSKEKNDDVSKRKLRIGILYVTAPTDEIYQRVEQRGVSTGRAVPPEFLERSMREVPEAIERLKPMADFFLHVHNAQQKNEMKVRDEKQHEEEPSFLVESTTNQTNTRHQDYDGSFWPRLSQPITVENPPSEVEGAMFQEKCLSIAGYG